MGEGYKGSLEQNINKNYYVHINRPPRGDN